MENYKQYIWNESKKKDRLLKRMMDAYQKNKRKKKIERLKDDPKHWKGLE